jgi:hypothetical protein
MSFPASPSNGQSAIVNNIAYTYSSTTNTWTRNAVGAVLNYFSANGALLAGNTTSSTSTTTGALQVAGGVGVQGNINVGNTLRVAGPIYSSGSISLATSLISTPGSGANINIIPDGIGSLVISSQTYHTNTTASTNSTTGALIVSGGTGVAGNVYVGQSIYVASNVAAGTYTRVETNFPHPFMLMGV